MAGEDKLDEIPEEDIPLLLDDLKSDFPLSVHAWSFLTNMLKWKILEPTLVLKILAPNGDFRTKMMVYFTIASDGKNLRGSIHKWSHREDDNDMFTEALKSTQKIPWDRKIILFTALTPETDKAVLPALNEIWKGQKWMHEPGHHVYWLPKEEAITWTVDLPAGTRLSFLSEDHAKEVDKVWPHRFPGSLQIIEEIMRLNFGLGLFNGETNELMAWALQWSYGAVGALQTKDHHKRKGYARVILRAVTKEVGNRGYDVHLNILPDNVPSLNLIKSSDYRFAFRSTWIFKGLDTLANDAKS